MINKVSRKKFHNIMLLLGFLFYLFFLVMDGPVIKDDSFSYIDMHGYREPVYTLFVLICRKIFPIGEYGYLYVVVFFQGILMTIASSSLAKYISDEFKLSNWNSLVVYSFPYLVSLLFRFAAGDPENQFMYSNTILTEGITIALHLLVSRFIFEYLRYQSRRSLLWSSFLCFIGISTRKQMGIWLIILVIVIFICNVKKKLVNTIVKCIAIWSVVILSSMLLDRTYNLLVNDQFSGHVNDNRFIATMIFYTADDSDINCIEDEELKNLYFDIYESCREQGLLKPKKEANLGWFERSYHFVCSYDQIQLKTMYPMIRDKLSTMNFASEIEDSEQRLDQVVKYYIDSCLLNSIPRMGSVYIDNILTGFVTTVAQRNRILSVFALFMYIGYFACMMTLFMYGQKKGCSEELKGILWWAVFVLISIVVNVGTVGVVIFCQTRYMIYNMAMFYMAFYIMIQYMARIFLNSCVRRHPML